MTDVHNPDYHSLLAPPDPHVLADLTFQDILYADDTLLIGASDDQITSLLQAIEYESGLYNLRLNRGKCELMEFNSNTGVVRFANQEKMKKTTRATYLGGRITANADCVGDLRARIGQCTDILN